MEFRIEKDALGEVNVPKEAYYGSFTVRAQANFQLSGQKPPYEFMVGIGLIKRAAAEVNGKLGVISKEQSKAIVAAADEFVEGRFSEEYTLDPFQAGAGTPFHMNCNEILANRATEIMGGEKGSYKHVHPNNHVNMGQSSNDVIPTAIRLTCLFLMEPLVNELEALAKALRLKADEAKGIVKVGRTHLEDAVPISLEQEIDAWASALTRSIRILKRDAEELLELPIGGTALGTGITAHPRFQGDVVRVLAGLTKLKLKPTENPPELISNMTVFSLLSANLRQVAIDFTKISGDLKLLNMGPKAGIAEITLPEVEPGSSIMPGKVNPSIPEAVHMAACQVMAADQAIMLGAQAGQLQLNVMGPMMLFNLNLAMKLLTNTAKMFRELAIEPLVINRERIAELFEGSLVTATALSPYLGYPITAKIVHEALEKGRTIRDMVLEHELVDEENLDRILSIDRMTKPTTTDAHLREQIQKSEAYKKIAT